MEPSHGLHPDLSRPQPEPGQLTPGMLAADPWAPFLGCGGGGDERGGISRSPMCLGGGHTVGLSPLPPRLNPRGASSQLPPGRLSRLGTLKCR